jgi:hypothetical protein
MRFISGLSIALFAYSLLAPLTAVQSEPALTPEPADHLLYESRLGKLVLLVGSQSTGKTQIWANEAGRWILVDGNGPPARELGGAAYDRHRRVIMLQGGTRAAPGGDGLSDTWE